MNRVLALVGASFAGAGLAHAQPINDLCGDAENISGYGTFAYDSTGATMDGGPSCAGGINYDIWYNWTAPETGSVEFSTSGMVDYDSALAVYVGSGCDDPFNGIDIGCDDDGGDGLSSRLVFATTAGQVYKLRVGSFAGAPDGGTGAFSLTADDGIDQVFGPIVNPANGHTYYLLTPRSWSDGQAAAEAIGGTLAIVNDAAENEWIRTNVLTPDSVDRRGWIGLTDENTGNNNGVPDFADNFVWVNGDPSPYRNWSSGEPNNTPAGSGDENYAEMFSNGFWNDTINAPLFSMYPIVEIPTGDDCPADYDNSGTVDSGDFFDFIGDFVAGNADYNNDTVTNSSDFFEFIADFLAGCP